MNATATRKPRRRWPWALLLFVLGSGAGLYGLSLDDEPPDDAELRAAPPLIDNAYAELRALHDEVFIPPSAVVTDADENYFGEEPFPLAVFDAYTAENAAVFDRVIELADRPLQAPLVEPKADLYDFKTIARWQAMRARVRARQGRSAEALEDIFAVLKLGSRMEAHAASILDWLIGISVRGTGAAAFEDALGHSVLDDPALAALDRRLANLPDLQGLAAAMRLEYRLISMTLKRMNADRLREHIGRDEAAGRSAAALLDTPLEGLVYKPNRTRARYADLIRIWARVLQGGEAPSIVELERWSYFEELASTNAVGRAVLRSNSFDSENLESLRLKRRQSRLEVELLRTLVALRRFRLAEGRLPKSLGELRPRFLKAIPEDLDGQPIRYRPDLELIYSVSRNLKDDIAASGDPESSPDRILSLKRRP